MPFIKCDYKMKWKYYGGKQNKTCSSTPLLSNTNSANVQNAFIKFCLNSKSNQISAQKGCASSKARITTRVIGQSNN
jgi:hypothetical protein